MSAAFSDVFAGAGIAVSEHRGDPPHDAPIWTEELRSLGATSEKRRQDFVAGRHCSREALRLLGEVPVPILRGPSGEPIWPSGVVGSITHTRGFAAAAVAREPARRSVGIDAEVDEPLPPDVVSHVVHGDELDRVRAGCEVANPELLIFCAKEAAYKAWFPLTRAWLGFEDVRVAVDDNGARIQVELLVDHPLQRFTGRFSAVDGLMLVGLEL